MTPQVATCTAVAILASWMPASAATFGGTLLEEGILRLSFPDASGPIARSAAFDGRFHYTVSGGTETGGRLARYLPDGSLDETFESMLDFRTVFTDNAGNLYASDWPARVFRLTKDGEATFLCLLDGAGLDKSLCFNGDDSELYTRDGTVVRRYTSDYGDPLGEIFLLGMTQGELNIPARYQLATSNNGRLFTYAAGVLSEWDLDGNRIGECSIPIDTPNGLFTTWSFAVDNDRVYLQNNLNLDWEVYDIGICSPEPSIHCTGKTNSLGCVPAISALGCPRVSLDRGFFISATNVRNQTVGQLIYGLNGRAAAPFQGGLLCFRPPVYRAPARSSSGHGVPIQDCSGRLRLDMNAFAAGAYGDPRPELRMLGTVVQCQWWGRDAGDAFGSSLSDALEYEVTP